MRWYTCTPARFRGDAEFFARDCGLFCRGFLALGLESRVVMSNPPVEGDGPEVLRTDYANLESADWWRAQGLDGVVLYAWGAPKYRQIARAIRESGTTLVLNQDSSGIITPLVGFREWLHQQWLYKGPRNTPAAVASVLWKGFRAFATSVLRTDFLRAIHLRQGSWIGCVSPAAAALFRKVCHLYGGRELADRVVVLPHPVTMDLASPDLGAKRRQIVAIGRWDDEAQKRPALLMAVLERVLLADPHVHAEVIGTRTPALNQWEEACPSSVRERLHLRGRLSHEEIVEILRASQVFYSSSAYESFGISAAEALCSGCSVVAVHSAPMGSFEWFVSQESGTLAEQDTPEAHADAVLHELQLWAAEKRSGSAIASRWRQVFPADRVAAAVLTLGRADPGSTPT